MRCLTKEKKGKQKNLWGFDFKTEKRYILHKKVFVVLSAYVFRKGLHTSNKQIEIRLLFCVSLLRFGWQIACIVIENTRENAG